MIRCWIQAGLAAAPVLSGDAIVVDEQLRNTVAVQQGACAGVGVVVSKQDGVEKSSMDGNFWACAQDRRH